jgi:hypothetical protein
MNTTKSKTFNEVIDLVTEYRRGWIDGLVDALSESGHSDNDIVYRVWSLDKGDDVERKTMTSLKERDKRRADRRDVQKCRDAEPCDSCGQPRRRR